MQVIEKVAKMQVIENVAKIQLIENVGKMQVSQYSFSRMAPPLCSVIGW